MCTHVAIIKRYDILTREYNVAIRQLHELKCAAKSIQIWVSLVFFRC